MRGARGQIVVGVSDLNAAKEGGGGTRQKGGVFGIAFSHGAEGEIDIAEVFGGQG